MSIAKHNKMKTINIEFGVHLMAEMQIDDKGEIRVLRAVNGWGEPIDISKVKITEAKK